MKKLPFRSFLSNLGRETVLKFVLLVKVPGIWRISFVSVAEYVKILSFTTESTSNVPLYPLSIAPEVLLVLVTFLMMIWSPTFRLCGRSAVTVIILETPLNEQVLINLGLRL